MIIITGSAQDKPAQAKRKKAAQDKPAQAQAQAQAQQTLLLELRTKRMDALKIHASKGKEFCLAYLALLDRAIKAVEK